MLITQYLGILNLIFQSIFKIISTQLIWNTSACSINWTFQIISITLWIFLNVLNINILPILIIRFHLLNKSRNLFLAQVTSQSDQLIAINWALSIKINPIHRYRSLDLIKGHLSAIAIILFRSLFFRQWPMSISFPSCWMVHLIQFIFCQR
jgi:hypothetical protein